MIMRVALILAVSLLTACDGGNKPLSHKEYQQEIHAIRMSDDAREADRLFFDLAAHDYGRQACATRARAFHERLERVDGLNPPEDAEGPPKEFLAAAYESVDRIGQLADAVDRGALACGMDFNRGAYGLESTKRAQRAIEELETRGYIIFGE
jgi:hypothetical protein